MKRHLFLDLEDTIITPVLNGWHNTELINVQKIRQIMGEFKPDTINIFSFAIWNGAELKQFNQGTRPMVERAIGGPLNIVPTVDDNIIPACCSILKISAKSVDFTEASAFWGKHESFRLFIRSLFRNTAAHGEQIEVLLLDDAVINERFEWPDLWIRGEIKNIQD